MLHVESIIDQHFPGLQQRRPLVGKSLTTVLRYLCHEQEFQQFERDYPHLRGLDFVDQVLRHFQFDYRLSSHERERIPVSGRLVIIANHPIGSLDGLALLKMVSEVRGDVKVVANQLLYSIPPLRKLLLPVDNMGNKSTRENIRAIGEHLQQEGVVIIFPAGEVSRFGPQGIRDGHWNTGFLRIASRHQAPILPIFINGRNSLFFYTLSLFARPLSTLWLVREMFKQANQHIDVRIGHPVHFQQYQGTELSPKACARLFKRYLYQLPKQRFPRSFGSYQQAIAHPENRQALKQAVDACEELGKTTDGKRILLYRYNEDCCLMREIGRLRELTFRAVKEGTGYHRDIDRFDSIYDHILVWDDDDLEIAGAYRLVQSAAAKLAGSQLYSETLFQYGPESAAVMSKGIELGRSFVQPRYWGKRSLDYLWQGVGAYLKTCDDIRYLFGPVSLSDSYPDWAKQALVQYYQQYYGMAEPLAAARTPFVQVVAEPLQEDAEQAFRSLRKLLSDAGLAVPTLYKQYTDLCQPGGVRFVAFNVDDQFGDCIDGLIVVDLDLLKPHKRQRYLGE